MSKHTLIPPNWAEGTFIEAVEIIRGISFPKDAKSFVKTADTIGCLRTTNVQATVEWENLWYLSPKYVRNQRQFVQREDILISTANSLELVGKVAQVSVVKTKATIGTFITLLRPNPNVNPRFIFHQLASLEFQQKIRETASTTTNISNVSGSKLASLSVLFAPRPEQDRIVNEIEKQFTRLDAAVAALKRVQANLKRYRAAILKAACEGRLVPTEAELARRESRSYEPASVLLTRILTERRSSPASAKTKGTCPQPTELSTLAEGWIWVSFDQILIYLRNGISQKPDASSGQPILRISAVRPMKVDLRDVRFLGRNTNGFSDYIIEDGDLLFTRYNGNPALTGDQPDLLVQEK